MNAGARWGRWTGCLAGVLLAAAAVEAGAQDAWRLGRSEHYTLIGDADFDTLAGAAARLEGFHAAATQLVRASGLGALPPVEVVVLADPGEVAELRLGEGAGHFVRSPRTGFLVLAADAEESFADALHQYFHAIAAERLPNLPLWLLEGLAEFHVTAAWTPSGQLELGRAIERHQRRLRDEDGPSFEALTAMTPDSAGYDEAARDGALYARSWAFVHYLALRNGGQGYAQLPAFVQAMATGRSFEEAVADVLGAGFRAVLAEFEEYTGSRAALPYLTVGIQGVSPDLTFRGEAASATADAWLGEALAASGRPAEAEARLARAIQREPGMALPRTALGALLLEERRFGEARASLERAVAAADADHWSHYYYARAIVEDAAALAGMGEAPVRAALERAVAISPGFADGHYELARSYLRAADDLDEAVRRLDVALERAPGRPDYLMTLSEALIELGRFDTARTVLLPLVADVRDDATRAAAAAMMRDIEGRESGGLRGDGFSEIRSAAAAPPPRPAPVADPAPRADSGVELTRVISGEQAQGRLLLVDCRDGLLLRVETEAGEMMFRTTRPENVAFSSADPAFTGEIRCGPVDPPRPVRVTYRPTEADGDSAGVPLEVEFAP